MPAAPGSVASIRWGAVCPWLILVRAARVSLMVRVILLALAGVVLTDAGWGLINRTLLGADGAPRLSRLAAEGAPWPPAAALAVDADRGLAVQAQAFGGPLVRGWHWASQPAIKLYDAEGWRQWVGLALAGIWGVAVWAVFGGAIGRIAALHLTYDETIGPVAALRAALAKWGATAGAPLMAAGIVLLLSLPLMLAGLLLRLDVMALLLGGAWLVVLMAGAAVAIVAAGLLLGWPLMWSTVAVERTDSFDGISRGYAYLYQRPLHLLFYLAAAGLLGLLAQAAVSLFVDATTVAAHWAVSVGAGESRLRNILSADAAPAMPLEGARAAGSEAMRFWTRALESLAAVFPMAYLWPAAVGVYLLLRRQIDSTEMSVVTFDEGDPQRGLPELADDPATGVPRVATDPPGAVAEAPAPPATPAPKP